MTTANPVDTSQNAAIGLRPQWQPAITVGISVITLGVALMILQGQTNTRIDATRAEVIEEIETTRLELNAEIKAVRVELREEIKAVRVELREEIKAIRSDLLSQQEDFRQLREDLYAIKVALDIGQDTTR